MATAGSGLALTLALWLAPCCAEVVVVVSAASPVTALSEAELEDLYLGRSNRFPGGHPAVPLDQRERTDAYPEFYATYMNQTLPQIRAHWSRLIFTGRGRPPRSVAGSREMADAVAADPHSIGYLEPSMVDDRLRAVRIE